MVLDASGEKHMTVFELDLASNKPIRKWRHPASRTGAALVPIPGRAYGETGKPHTP